MISMSTLVTPAEMVVGETYTIGRPNKPGCVSFTVVALAEGPVVKYDGATMAVTCDDGRVRNYSRNWRVFRPAGAASRTHWDPRSRADPAQPCFFEARYTPCPPPIPASRSSVFFDKALVGLLHTGTLEHIDRHACLRLHGRVVTRSSREHNGRRIPDSL